MTAASGYEGYIRELGDEERLDNLAEFKRIANEFEREFGEDLSLEGFLQQISLQAGEDSEESKDAVKLMTIHSSKGLEFPVVFILGFTEGIFPSSKTLGDRKKLGLEEERRLCYVAITRAEKHLFLMESEGSSQTGSKKLVSRFLEEIGEKNYVRIGRISDELMRESRGYAAKLNGEMQPESTEIRKAGDIVEHHIFGKGVIESVDEKRKSYSVKFDKLQYPRSISSSYFEKKHVDLRQPNQEKETGSAADAATAGIREIPEAPKACDKGAFPNGSIKGGLSNFGLFAELREKSSEPEGKEKFLAERNNFPEEADFSDAEPDFLEEADFSDAEPDFLEEEDFSEEESDFLEEEDFSEEESDFLEEDFSEEESDFLEEEDFSEEESDFLEEADSLEEKTDFMKEADSSGETDEILTEGNFFLEKEADVNPAEDLENEKARTRLLQKLKADSPNLWKREDVPHSGWSCVGVEDLGEPAGICEMCGYQIIRYVHQMEHPGYRSLAVGCVCAGRMEGDVEQAKRREAEFKSRQSRRVNFFKRKWKQSRKGNEYLKINGHVVVLYHHAYDGADRKGKSVWKYSIDSTFCKAAYATRERALAGVFDALERMKE